MADTPPPVETREIASIGRDIFQMPLAGILLNRDDTLLARGGGQGLKIYDEIERDLHAFAVLEKRKLAVVARPWQVEGASEAEADSPPVQLIRDMITGVAFDRICKELLDATLKGYAVSEIMWEVREGRILPADILPRDQRRFLFDVDRLPRLLTRENMMPGEVLPERKFIVHRQGSKDASPYGLGLGTRLFWAVWFKRNGAKFWATFLDKFGTPTSVGKYPSGTGEPDQAKLLAALQAISTDSGIIIPDGMLIELLEAQRSGSGDPHEKFLRYWDEQISECVLGETMTTTSHASGLGSNQASVQNEVRLELAQADADLLSDTLNSTLVRWVIDYNLPGAPCPKIYRDFTSAPDLESRSKTDTAVFGLGFEPSEQYIQETYGEGWTKKKVQPPPIPGRNIPNIPPTGSPDAGAAQFAGPPPAQADEPDGVDLQAEQLARRAAPAMQRVLTHLQGVVDHAESLESLRDDLLASYGHLPIDDLQRVMQQAFAAADAAGRFEAKQGS